MKSADSMKKEAVQEVLDEGQHSCCSRWLDQIDDLFIPSDCTVPVRCPEVVYPIGERTRRMRRRRRNGASV
jgi:hypothetical protein